MHVFYFLDKSDRDGKSSLDGEALRKRSFVPNEGFLIRRQIRKDKSNQKRKRPDKIMQNKARLEKAKTKTETKQRQRQRQNSEKTKRKDKSRQGKARSLT
jgi:hypothetical protein